MPESSDSWKDLRSKVEGLGLKLKLHLEQENDDDDNSTSPGDTKAAFDELNQKLQDAFASFTNAAKDPAVKADMKEIGSLFRQAMSDTFNSVGAEVSDAINKRTKSEDNDGPIASSAEDAAGETDD